MKEILSLRWYSKFLLLLPLLLLWSCYLSLSLSLLSLSAIWPVSCNVGGSWGVKVRLLVGTRRSRYFSVSEQLVFEVVVVGGGREEVG